MYRVSQLVRHHMRYGQGVGRTSLTLGFGDVRLMLIDYKLIRSDKYSFIGYPKETRGYYFYRLAEQNVFVSSKAHFT